MNALKATLTLCSLLFVSLCITEPVQGQFSIDSTKTYLVIKNDGSEFVGKILSHDAREILIATNKQGQVIIPRHEIKEIRELDEEEITNEGNLRLTELFATRYFIATNGLPMKKGDSYIIWNLFGPDLQFGVSDNFGLGIMTSWVGYPIIGSAKYTLNLGENTNLALGTLLGTGSWALPEFGIALPYSALTFGDRAKNITFSVGYGGVWVDNESDGRALLSIAGITKVSEKFSFVFDSFIITGSSNDSGAALLIPGIRVQTQNDRAFQLGFAGVAADGKLSPLPIPMIQWFRKL